MTESEREEVRAIVREMLPEIIRKMLPEIRGAVSYSSVHPKETPPYEKIPLHF